LRCIDFSERISIVPFASFSDLEFESLFWRSVYLRPNLIRAALIGGSVMVAAMASAQTASVQYWFNLAGSAATDGQTTQPDITVNANSSVTLSIYFQLNGVGSTSVLGTLFGYTKTAGAAGAGSSGAADGLTVASVGFGGHNSFGGADTDVVANNDGGSFTTIGTTRPFGRYLAYSSPIIAGTPTLYSTVSGTVYHFADITMNVGALSAGTVDSIFLPMVTPGSPQDYSSYAFDGSNNSFTSTSNYQRNLVVAAVPEPVSIAALGLGVFALLRRRRKA
jgi:hypothetical protein